MDRGCGRRAAAAYRVLRQSSSPTLRRFGQLRTTTCEEIEHRHAYGHAVRHLVEDHAVRPVGDVRIDLDAAVHRARMEDEHISRCALEPLARHAEDAIVL